jgi:inhibitor of KinA
MPYERPLYRIMGDGSMIVELGNTISPAINRKVSALTFLLEKNSLDGIVDIVPAYRSILISYQPLKIDARALKTWIDGMQERAMEISLPEPETVDIPVVYGGHHGPDLEWVAQYHGITPDEVIRLHTANMYYVYMIGFTPGFPYMGELPQELDTPRKETPRTAIPEGSVGIAQRQTGIYPVASPGGWQIIGRSPIKLFIPSHDPPALLKAGDLVRFSPIDEKDFSQWKQ